MNKNFFPDNIMDFKKLEFDNYLKNGENIFSDKSVSKKTKILLIEFKCIFY